MLCDLDTELSSNSAAKSINMEVSPVSSSTDASTPANVVPTADSTLPSTSGTPSKNGEMCKISPAPSPESQALSLGRISSHCQKSQVEP